MPQEIPPQLQLPGALALALFEAAEKTARAAAAMAKNLRRPRGYGCTLRPGALTPLWNELIIHATPYLHKRGAKSNLARLLGVPRQRIQDYLMQRKASPDAERTLLLLCWVSARAQGREIAG